MKNIVTGLVGIIISIVMMILLFFGLINLDIGPFKIFLTGNFNHIQYVAFSKQIVISLILLIFPISFITTGLVVALLAKNKEYWVASICCIPALIICIGMPISYYLLSLLSLSLSIIIGVKIGIFIKHGRGKILSIDKI
jgi:hypothetical protein